VPRHCGLRNTGLEPHLIQFIASFIDRHARLVIIDAGQDQIDGFTLLARQNLFFEQWVVFDRADIVVVSFDLGVRIDVLKRLLSSFHFS
jgi:hypothetical protein